MPSIEQEIMTHSFSITKKQRHNEVYHMPLSHYHENYEIYYLLEGTRKYFIEEKTYLVQKGDIVLIPKDAIHRTLNYENPRHTKIMIHFKEDYLCDLKHLTVHQNPLSSFYSGSPIIRLNLKEQQVIETLLMKILTEHHTDRDDGLLYTKICFTELLLILNRYKEKQDSHHYDDMTTLHSKITDIVQYITEHYKEPLTLDLLSQQFFISPNYLCKIFKEATGFTMVNFLNQVRIKNAQVLLRETVHPVSFICEEVGFTNNTHFGRVFKQMVGHSPLNYRKYSKC